MRLKLFYLITYLVLLTLIFNSLKYNVASDYRLVKYFGAFIPQGWGFFTRNPREEQLNFSLYNYKDKSMKEIEISTGSINHLLGLSRAGRFRGREFVILLERANKDSLEWKDTNIIDSFNIKKVMYKKEVVSFIDTGTYCIERFEPLPWAWASVQTTKDIEKKYTYIKFEYEY